jgi:hypothetical protein
MAKPHTHSWAPEKLALLSRADVETARKNALRLDVEDLVRMCELDLEKRAPLKTKRAKQVQPKDSPSDFVGGYHFVCERDRGVTLIGDGRFWSGSWVVSEANVRKSLQYVAYLALLETKSDVSYRQGQILNYRRSARDMLPAWDQVTKTRNEEGIEFLVQETNEPYSWIGGGSGEKGYRWTKIVGTPKPETDTIQVTSP